MSDKRIALVTGANQGIGLQIAKDLVANGLSVLVGARDHDKGLAAAAEIGADAYAIQLDVTDAASIAAAAERIGNEFGRLDILINNAAISHTGRAKGATVEEHAEMSKASNVSLDEVRAVWETNVFGPLAVYQAMLPLLRKSSAARIVNVSSGVGSLTTNLDPAFGYRKIYGPAYPASKAAMNAMSVAMAIEVEDEGIRVNVVTPGFTKTNLNNFAGTETVEQGAAEAVRVAMLEGGPTGTFTGSGGRALPW